MTVLANNDPIHLVCARRMCACHVRTVRECKGLMVAIFRTNLLVSFCRIFAVTIANLNYAMNSVNGDTVGTVGQISS